MKEVAGSAAGVAALNLEQARAAEDDGDGEPSLLPTVPLGPHRISRLILGGNPIYGYSHFNRLYSKHLRDYHTPERVVDLLRSTVKAGINTWQNSWAPRTVEDVERCRAEGVPFRWLLLGKPNWDRQPEVIEEAARKKPVGIAPHGALGERLHRQGKTDVLKDLLKRIRATGVLVGLSAHNPALIELSEEEGWDVDYYMCCLYYLTRPREEFARILGGEVPVGEVYLPSDRERMLGVVKKATKPCLVYKVLAAGRNNLSPSGIRGAFKDTLSRIKPHDAMIVGMFQEFGDQVATNARYVREALKS
ncbi:MAG: hypothetical protein O7J95_15825 [Planctomycetota bacterium]|nr:hypothetical protein [Planctomycetota bacterium]